MLEKCVQILSNLSIICFIAASVIISSTDIYAQTIPEGPDFSKILPSVIRIHVSGEAEDAVIDQYGTGLLISEDGLILTAFHTVGIDDHGRKIVWKTRNGNPKIEVEAFTNFGLLSKLPVSAVVYSNKVEPDLDVAILKVDGASYSTANCKFSKIGTHSRVWGLAWRPGKNAYDLLEGKIGPTDSQDGARYRLVNMSAYKGNSGGPVIDSNGNVVAIITSGKDGRLLPGASETFATPLYEFYYLFRPFGSCAPIRLANLDQLPKSVGFYTVKAELPSKQRESRKREETFDVRNEHCDPPREVVQPFSAAQGWKVDPASVLAEHGKSSMTSYAGITDLSETGFTLRARVANNGICIPALSVKDGKGSLWGKVSWNEYKDVEKNEEKELATGKLNEGQVITLELPSTGKNLKILFATEDGNTEVLRPGMGNQAVHIEGGVESGKLVIQAR